MIHFTCPGCECAHQANEAFANRRAKCVRCGATIIIPEESGEARYSPQASDLPVSDEDSSLFPEQHPDDGPELPKPRKKSKLGLILAVLLLLLVAGAIYYFGFSKTEVPPAKKVAPPPDEEKPVALPPPPVTPVVEPVVIATPTPIRINADRLQLEYSLDPKGTDEKYSNKLLEIQGNCLTFLVAKLEFQTATAGGDLAVGGIKAILPAYVNYFGDEKERPLAIIGSMAIVPLTPPEFRPKPGYAVAVRGMYWGSGTIKNAELIRLSAPADAVYLRKPVIVEGVVFGVDEGENGSTIITFRAQTTVPLVTIHCRFLLATSKPAQKLKPGQFVTIGGTCSGRDWTTVRLDNCAIGNPPGDNGPPIVVSVTKLIADYEVDLLRFPAIPPDSPPIKITAEQLANAYRTNAKDADEKFAMKRLILTGYLLPKTGRGTTVKFETGTDSGNYLVRAAMLPADYAMVPWDATEICVKGVFYGKGQSNVLQLEDAKYYDPDDDNPNIQRLTADYFPIAPNREWDAIRIVYTEPLPPPVKPPPKTGPAPKVKPLEHLVTRLHYRMTADSFLVGAMIQAGKVEGEPVFAGPEDVTWAGKPVPFGSPLSRIVDTMKLRTTDTFIESGVKRQPNDDTPIRPGTDPKDAAFTWYPLLRLKAKIGRSWEYETAPGVLVKTTVDSFDKDKLGRQTVKLVTVTTDEKLKGKRLETVVILTRGIGEVRRKVTYFDGEKSRVTMEQRIDGEPKIFDPKAPLPKDKPTGPKPPPSTMREILPPPREAKPRG